MNVRRIYGRFILISVVIPTLCASINKDLNMSQDNFVGCYAMYGWFLHIKRGCWDNSHSLLLHSVLFTLFLTKWSQNGAVFFLIVLFTYVKWSACSLDLTRISVFSEDVCDISRSLLSSLTIMSFSSICYFYNFDILKPIKNKWPIFHSLGVPYTNLGKNWWSWVQEFIMMITMISYLDLNYRK